MGPQNAFLYTALGDSLSVGTGSLLAPGFEKRYAKLAEQTLRWPIDVNIFAKNGATSADILRTLYSPKVRNAIYQASIITVTAGGNDLIHASRAFAKTGQAFVFHQAFTSFSQHLSQMMTEIHKIKSTAPFPFFIRIIGLYNPSPDTPGSDYWVQHFNRLLLQFENINTQVADVYKPFQQYGKKALFIDGLHPNGRGYQIIAETLHHLGYFPLIQYQPRKTTAPI